MKSAGQTGWVKPVNLSVRFILGDEEQDHDDHPGSESELLRMILMMIGSHVSVQ